MLKKVNENDFIVSKTNTKGHLTYCNKIFMDIAEYKEEELLGKPHNILRHPDMPKAIFKYLWEEISKKREVFAFVLNKTRNGNEYWVYANITATLDHNGNIIDYYSIRRKANQNAIDIIVPLYKRMNDIEKKEGITASLKVLTDISKEKGVDLNEFIISIQEQ